MGGTRTWRLAKLRCTVEPVAMAQRLLGNTRKRWSWSWRWYALTIRRIAATGATINRQRTEIDHLHHIEASDDTQ
jgi:hypothetical protein